MKNTILLSVMFLFLAVGLYAPASYSSEPTPTGSIVLANATETNATGGTTGFLTRYEFDIILYSAPAPAQPWRLSGIQIGLQYNYLIKGPNRHMSVSWVAGSTDASLTSIPPGQAPGTFDTATVVGNIGVLKVSAKLPSGVGSPPEVTGDVAKFIKTALQGGTRLGRVRMQILQATGGFDNTQQPNVTFNQTGSPLYPTQPGAYVLVDSTYDPDNDWYVHIYNNVDITAGVTTVNNLANNSPLPVELSSLTSAAQGRSVVLNWSTKTEKNSDRFEVQRSLVSNVAWSTVGTVKASVLSNSTKNYTYTDTKLQSGKYQYRLRLVDNDGTFAYSQTTETEVALPKDFAVSQNYPNPFNPTTKIDYQVPVDSKILFEVYNITGQRVAEVVNQTQSAGYYTVDFGASKFASGVYIYRITAQENATGKNFSSIKKMMLLK